MSREHTRFYVHSDITSAENNSPEWEVFPTSWITGDATCDEATKGGGIPSLRTTTEFRYAWLNSCATHRIS